MGGFFLLVWLCAPGVQAVAAAQGDFVLVVNVSNDQAAISRKDLELIFLSRKRSWPNRGNIAPVINENPKIYDSFSYNVLKRSPRQYLIFRKKILFRGKGMPPPSVKTDKEVIAFVADHVGGLGYISPESLTPAVKVIPILE